MSAVSTRRPVRQLPSTEPEARRLPRDLRPWQLVGLSAGMMAPSMAVNINPQGAIGAVGRAIPLSFLIAMGGTLLISYGFARLSRHFTSAGSVFALVGATLGPRAGLVAGVGLGGVYTLFTVLSSVAGGLFVCSLLSSLGIWAHPATWAPYPIAAAILGVCILLALWPTRRSTGVIVGFELATVALIVVATVVIFVDLFTHHTPAHQHFTWSIFVPAPHSSLSDIFLGVVFGFLSFGGFEGAATLGEESRRPKRDVGRAVVFTPVAVGVFFVVVTAAEVLGFGTNSAGLSGFAASQSLFGTLGGQYIATWFGNLITLGTVVSAIGCCLACVVGASRMLFALSRAGSTDARLASLRARWGTPVPAVATIGVASVTIGALFALAARAQPIETFAWSGLVGTLLLLVVYLMVSLGAGRFLFLAGKHRAPRWQAVIPAMAVALLGYTIYRNLAPWPAGPEKWLPLISAAWLVGTVVMVMAWRRATDIGRRLCTAMDTDGAHEPAAIGGLVPDLA